MKYTYVSSFSSFAAVDYDCNAYGVGNYNDSELCNIKAPNTGIGVGSGNIEPAWSAASIVLGIVLIAAGIFIIIKKRRGNNSDVGTHSQ